MYVVDQPITGHYSLKTASDIKSELKFEISDLMYPCACCLHGVGPFGSIQGHYNLKAASKAKYDLIFEINDLD